MDTITVNKERLVRLQHKLQSCQSDLIRSPHLVQNRLAKMIEEVDAILTEQPGNTEEGDKYER